jgi:hypothetical protein
MIGSLTLGAAPFDRHTSRDAIPRFCVSTADTSVRLGMRLLGVRDWVRAGARSSGAPYPNLPSATT